MMQAKQIETLYQEHLPELLLTAYYYLSDEEEAKDVVSDVFERLLNKPPLNLAELMQFEGIKNYLFIIVKHKCLDVLKKHKNRANIVAQLPEYQEEKLVAQDFESESMVLLLKDLPERQREVLQMSIEGFNNNEISDKLNISYNTVRNTLHAAKKRSRMLWDNFFC